MIDQLKFILNIIILIKIVKANQKIKIIDLLCKRFNQIKK